MARETIVRLLDDFDRTQEASETVVIGYRGFLYELDLTDEHARELDAAIDPWITAAHGKSKWPKRTQVVNGTAPAEPAKAAPRKRATAGLTAKQRGEIRQWGRDNGFEVATRGYLKPDLVKAYKKANKVTGKP